VTKAGIDRVARVRRSEGPRSERHAAGAGPISTEDHARRFSAAGTEQPSEAGDLATAQLKAHVAHRLAGREGFGDEHYRGGALGRGAAERRGVTGHLADITAEHL
jgi:hypothetical protein